MFEQKSIGLDLKTPINESLTAFYQRSFAYHSVKLRLPTILFQTIDVLTKKKETILRPYGEEAEEEFKTIVAEISKLKAEIQTNKPMRKLVGDSPDIDLYNKALQLQSVKVSRPTYFNASWLFVECYTFRRIIETIDQCKTLKNLDPFQLQKEDWFFRALVVMAPFADILQQVLAAPDEEKEQEFVKLMKLNLWGNKCDLSLSLGRIKYNTDNLTDTERLDANILCNECSSIWVALTKVTGSQIVDIVLGNAGYELFTDLCLADFIINNKYAEHVRFYVKSIPWFISDTTAKDFNWTLHQLKVCKNSTLKKLGERWNNYIRIKAWTIEEHVFWTLPLTYKHMQKWDMNLYTKLSTAKLVFFKGDVNYRKLFDERNWPPTKGVEDALQGFYPTKLGIVRAVKAHIICGLAEGIAEGIEKVDSDWMTTGKYGVIQFCDVVQKKQ